MQSGAGIDCDDDSRMASGLSGVDGCSAANIKLRAQPAHVSVNPVTTTKLAMRQGKS